LIVQSTVHFGPNIGEKTLMGYNIGRKDLLIGFGGQWLFPLGYSSSNIGLS
jgi:hypothetical protein